VTSSGSPPRERTRSIYAGQWRIDLTVRPSVANPLSGAAVARAAWRALDAAGASSPASLGVILSDDSELAALNATHMGSSGPTDILSFPLLPPEAFPAHRGKRAGAVGAPRPGPRFVLPPTRRVHLGDIVISVERAIAQAAAGRGGLTGDLRRAPSDERPVLVTHGELRVTGWDHADPVEKGAMGALEQRLLSDHTR
jgi:probable rRNA maturation factor